MKIIHHSKYVPSLTKEKIHEIKKHIYEVGKARDSYHHWGEDKVNGEPTRTKKGKELEFYMGAYSTLTKVMSILENISIDEAMQYFDPIVTIGAIRGDSITKQFAKHRFNKEEDKGIDTKYNNFDLEAK